MKKKKTIFYWLIIIILLLIIIFVGVQFYFKVLDNNFQKYSNLQAMNSDGLLIDDYSNLKDSNITGEDYSFDTVMYPYYDMLNDKEKELYKQVYANFDNLKTTFVPVVKTDKNVVDKVIESVLNDHPEIFWMGKSYSYKYTQDGICRQVILKFNDLVDNFEYNKNKMEAFSNDIIKNAKNKKTDYEKEIYVHDELIKRISYDKQAPYNQTSFSALVNNNTVCAGYARAFQYIMLKLNIPTYYVTGVSDGEDHAWNIIKLDGYYNIDLTWDDAAYYSYKFFNLTDREFASTHSRSTLSSLLPSCNSKVYAYQKRQTVIINNIVPKKDTKDVVRENIENNNKEKEKQVEDIVKKDEEIKKAIDEVDKIIDIDNEIDNSDYNEEVMPDNNIVLEEESKEKKKVPNIDSTSGEDSNMTKNLS